MTIEEPVAGDEITCPFCQGRHVLVEPQEGTLAVDCPNMEGADGVGLGAFE